MSRIFLVLGLFVNSLSCVSSTALPSHGIDSSLLQESVSLQERQALIALYQATGGAHWKNSSGWLGPVGTECIWHGVLCEPGAGKPATVIDLDLAENNLAGSVPEAVVELRNLQSLAIFGNHLSGQIPELLVTHWLAGSLSVSAEAFLLTNISEIDFESSPSALLCGRYRILLRADTAATRFDLRCHNETPEDRTTYCEVRDGHISGLEFARLAWAIENNGYFALQPDYQKNVTDAEFVSVRVIRAGKRYEVVDYAGAGPIALWTIHHSIEGVAALADWGTNKTQVQCPAWKSPVEP